MDVVRTGTLVGMIAIAVGLSLTAHLLLEAPLLSISFPLVGGALFYVMIMIHAIRCTIRRRGRRPGMHT
ncbi:hypothetical protein OIU34_23950 [Pararhizobium sp. BT-229]|uniref:hypothetical protein n=1 Tax=Pararhizobium sp. BT-229 TaxID=2986923 RepID=UPI0021F76B79|nr:hypothetical protein [Pararhizobium sp. BT-229]MCV9964952.1 hypothetical protein [Pararhizobium sp. BT-229]